MQSGKAYGILGMKNITTEESMENQIKDINDMTVEELQKEKEITLTEIDQTQRNIQNLQTKLADLQALIGPTYQQTITDCKEKVKQSTKRTFAAFGIAALFGIGGLGFMPLYNILAYTLFGCILLPLTASLIFAEQGSSAQRNIKTISETLHCIEILTEAIGEHENTKEKQTNYLAKIDNRIIFLNTHKFINFIQEMKNLNNEIKEFNDGLDNIANKAKSINRNFDGINDTLDECNNEQEN